MANSSDIAQSDLAELLNVLGMGDHARPQSPHEVFQEALRVLRARVGKPAPDSTRTGAAETSAEDDITQAMIQAGRYAANLNDGTLASIYLSMLAARPEAPSDAGWVLVPADDDALDHADSRLPLAMIEAGHDAYVRVQNDLTNYVAGETPDWDAGMAAVAVYRAMLAARPLPTPPSDPAPSGQAEC